MGTPIFVTLFCISIGHSPWSSSHPPGESVAGGGRPDGAAGAGDRGLPCPAARVSALRGAGWNGGRAFLVKMARWNYGRITMFTLWKFNIATENDPSVVSCPMKNGDFP